MAKKPINPWRAFAMIAVVLVFIAIIVLVLTIHDEALESGSDFIVYIQNVGGKYNDFASEFFSSPLVYWIIPYLHFYTAVNRDIRFMLYLWTCLLIPMTTAAILRAAFYQERPYAVHKDVVACRCDPGMPSGHMITATMAFFIFYQIVKRHYIPYRDPNRRLKKVLLAIALILINILVGVSRVTLGDHDFLQVAFGIAIGAVWIPFLSFKLYLRALYAIRYFINTIAVLVFILINAWTLIFLYVNHRFREDPVEWKYLEAKCPVCRQSWVYGQTYSLVIMNLLPALYIAFPFYYDRHAYSNPEVHFTKMTQFKRYLVLIVLTIFWGIVPGYFKAIWEPDYRDKYPPIYEQCLLNYIIILPSAAYLGVFLTRVRNWAYGKTHLLSPNDFLNLEELPIKIPIEDDAVDVPLLDNVAADFSSRANLPVAPVVLR